MKNCIGLALLCFCTLSAGAHPKLCPGFPTSKDPKSWIWWDRNCNIHSRSELDAILKNHLKWLVKYNGLSKDEMIASRALEDPLRADLSAASLEYADLTGADLEQADLADADLSYADLADADFEDADLAGLISSFANLTSANLEGSDLTGAGLDDADLTGAHLLEADLTKAVLWHAHLVGAKLGEAHLSGANLAFADLTDAELQQSDLTGSHLEGSDLTGAKLGGADLTDASLFDSDLTESDLRGARLSGVNLAGAELWNAIFEPGELPPPNSIAAAEGLRTLRWWDSNVKLLKDQPKTQQPTPAVLWMTVWWPAIIGEWKHAFGAKRGPGKRGKVVTERAAGGDELRLPPNPYPLIDMLHKLREAGYGGAEKEVNLAYHRRVETWWQIPVFDWTCEWGANWSRPVKAVGWIGFFCAVLYWVFLRLTNHNRLYVIGYKGSRQQQMRVGKDHAPPCWLPVSLPGRPHWRRWLSWGIACSVWTRLRWEQTLLCTAVLFSLMSVVNLGVQGIDLGRWVRLTQGREFDLKARGTIRTVAGAQSVLSFILLLLAAVSYFGHPFE